MIEMITRSELTEFSPTEELRPLTVGEIDAVAGGLLNNNNVAVAVGRQFGVAFNIANNGFAIASLTQSQNVIAVA
jgi:hypothetical protein